MQSAAKNIWVINIRRKTVSRLKIATYNAGALLRDEHILELEEELRETKLVWDVIWIGEVSRPGECFTTLQSDHLLYHSKGNDGRAGVGFLINGKWKNHKVRLVSKQNQPQSSRTCSVHTKVLQTKV